MMRMRPRTLALTGAALAALTLVGCGQNNAAAPADQTAANGEAPQNLTPENGINVAALWGGGKPMPLELQSVHPNGTVLQVTSIQAKPTETVLGVTVVNGDDSAITLNRWNNNKDGYIVASTGEKLYLSPPAGNPTMSVPQGQTMQGELVFLGRLPKSGDATLVLNEGSNTNQYTDNPTFQVPLPLSSAAFSDDGSKKN